MPYRVIPIVTGEIYHVFNRSVARQPIFLTNKDYQRGLEILYFYSFVKPGLSFSHYKRLSDEERIKFLENLEKASDKLIQLLVFCLMPNHFHFLLREIKPNGITISISNLQNSYAKYFNTRSERNGALFQARFKAVRIETDEQLIHVARYIHLNPLTSFVIKEISQLEHYYWSSFPEYLNNENSKIIDKSEILPFFKTTESLKKFHFDRVNYQRELDLIKHLILE